MKPTPSFVISEFTNPSGEIVFRVSGWLDGKRVRKNFPTRAEAKAEADALEIEALQSDTGLRRAVTRLREEQLHEAEAVFRRLDGQPHSLMFCVDYTLAHYRAPGSEKPLADAAAKYIASKERERDQHALSACHVKNIAKEMKKLLTYFKGSKLPELTPQRLTAFCERGKPALKTVNCRRGILSTFFKFAFQRDWVAANPVAKIPSYRLSRQRSSADTLTAAKAGELMAFVESYRGGELVPFYALCLFAGIRPCLRSGEIMKLRPEHIQLDEDRIVIPPEVSKVHEKRVVAIQPNLAAWLRAYPLERYLIMPSKHIQNTREPITQRFGLPRDVLRHTFISMFVAKFRSLGEAALQAGNSENIIRKHYLDLKSKEEAEQFWSIRPTRCADEAPAPSALPASADRIAALPPSLHHERAA